MKARGKLAVLLLVLVPVVVCSAPAARVAEGPVVEAVRRGIASGKGAFDHGRWDALLRRHVDEGGRVDYAGLAKDRSELDAYLVAVGSAELAALPGPELLALLINAYNACTAREIVDAAEGGRFPASIRDLSDPWGRKTCAVGGQSLSLDTIEHGILRPIFKDTRIHAAVNCASRSCPALAPRAYRGDGIEEQLREQMQAMVNSEAHVRVEGDRLKLTKIFDWYGKDFTDASFKESASSVGEYVLRHARPELRRRIEALGASPRVEFLGYDWALNGR